MPTTIGSTGITFPDATVQTTASTGGGPPQATFTAAASITAGQPVVFTTGTNVTPVAGASYTQAVAGSNTVLSGNIGDINATEAYDPNTAGSFVACSMNSSGDLAIQAGTTSGNTTTVGTAAIASIGAYQGQFGLVKVMFDPVTAGKGLAFVYIPPPACGSGSTYAVIFTVSGTTATIQSTTTISTSGPLAASFSYYGQDRFVVTYLVVNGASTAACYARACSISTYTITQGTQTTITTVADPFRQSRAQNQITIDYSPITTNLLAIAASVNSPSNGMGVCLISVDPATRTITSGSFSSPLGGTNSYYASVAFDPNVSNRLVLGTAVYISATYRAAVYGLDFTAATLTMGSRALLYNFNPGGSWNHENGVVKFIPIKNGGTQSVLTMTPSFWVAGCCVYTFGYFNSLVLTTSTYDTAVTAASPTGTYTISQRYTNVSPSSVVSGQTQKVTINAPSGIGSATLRFGQATVTDTNLVSANLIGIANASASASASVLVNVLGGVDTNQTGLTTNSTYYVTPSGTLTTTSTSPNVKIGRAISATSLLLQGLSI